MPGDGGYKKFIEWRSELLSQHGLKKPDGRALFLYRLSDEQFSGLETMLREAIGHFAQTFGLAAIGRLNGFHGLFVLYAAEWWRRRYDGHGFSWEPILRDLGAAQDDWTPQERGEFITKGLKQWELQPRRSGALRFLGTVAVQGGLPLNLLASARGGIGRLLKQVLRQASLAPWSDADLDRWVQSLQGQLPKTYRRQEIYTLLADTAAAVLKLKEEAGLQSSADALSVLDQRVPGWRDRFPLPIDDAHAQGMIEQLIRDVADTKARKVERVLPVERILTEGDEGAYCLESRINVPEHLSASAVATLFGVEISELPRVAELVLQAGGSTFQVQMRKLSGRDTYRLTSGAWIIPMPDTMAEHAAKMILPNGRVMAACLPNGDSVDDDLPWVFSREGEELRFFAQGSCSLGQTSAIVALPKSWHWDVGKENAKELILALTELDRSLFELEGDATATSTDGESVRIRTGQAGVERESFIWSGRRVWLDFVYPKAAFRGKPKLLKAHDAGSARRVDGEPLFAGSSRYGRNYGPVIAKYPASGNIRVRTRMVLLPESAELDLESIDPRSGFFRLKGWGAAQLRVLNDGVDCVTSRDSAMLSAKVSVKHGTPAPEYLNVEISWDDNPLPAILNLPFPGKGVRAFGRDGQELHMGSELSMREVVGTRISIFQQEGSRECILEITGSGTEAYRRYRLMPSVEDNLISIRLQDYLSDIKELLSSDDSQDAHVSVQIRMRGREEFEVKIRSYDAVLERHGMTVGLADSIGASALKRLPEEPFEILASRLDRPEDEPELLAPIYTEGVWTGTWSFMNLKQARSPGIWLIYPAETTAEKVRPTVWYVEGEQEKPVGIRIAVNIPQEDLRISAYRDSFAEMVEDFNHSDWSYTERLILNTVHLPLSSLDIWRAFVRDDRAMAALALRFGSIPEHVLERFSLELPFAWECVPLEAWKSAAERLRAQCNALFGESGETVFREYLERRVEAIQSFCPAMAYLMGIVLAEFCPVYRKEVDLLALAVGRTAADRLFSGPDSSLQKLRRSHAEEQWPNECGQIVEEASAPYEVEPYLNTFSPAYQSAVANIPLLLAFQVASNDGSFWFGQSERIQGLKSCKAFAPEWFEDAFNLTIARCLSDGIISQES